MKLRMGQLSWRRAMQHGTSGQYRAFQVTFGVRKYAHKQATAVGLVLARQELPDCPEKGKTHTQLHCAVICALIPEASAPFQTSVRVASQHQQRHHSWRKRRATCYNHGPTLGYREPLYAPPHTSPSKPTSSSKKTETTHKFYTLG